MRVITRNLSRIAAVLAFAASATPVFAASSANLDITVSISSTKALTVGATFYDFGAQTINASAVSGSAIVVTNTSTALVETYTIQGAAAPSTESGTSWTLAGSPALDTYVLSAQFKTTAPADATDGNWTSDDLTTSAIVCSAGTLGSGTAGESGFQVSPSATRNLWFRIKTPTAITDGGNHKATLVLAIN